MIFCSFCALCLTALTPTPEVCVAIALAECEERATTSEPEKPLPALLKKVLKIVPCPSGVCPLNRKTEWVWEWVDKEPTVAEAAAIYASGRKLTPEEDKRLGEIIDRPWKEKARKGHLSPGSCAMLGCPTHEGNWVWDDEESQEETDAKTVPWGSEGGRWRLFGRRR